ncbi:uncharacterized protein [Argopecten irradians]|uniref:uncharacterized protein n=1 Tax=Argopecten irradians TaxID=31199 RepID=UPI00371DA8E1
MATSKDGETLQKFLQTNGLTECMEKLEKIANDLPSTRNKIKRMFKSLIEKLKRKIIEYKTDPTKLIIIIISVVLALIRTLIPVDGVLAIAIYAIQPFLTLCEFFGVKVFKLNITEMIEEQSRIGLEKEAHAAQGALASSMGFLMAIPNGEFNKHEIGIIQNHVPKNLGTEFIGKLEDKIRELLRFGKEGEKEEETLNRCNRIVRHIDRYCILSCLRELVISYLVTIFINNGVPQNITDSYLERRERFKGTRDDLLKVLYRPDPRDACVAASFNNIEWPLLSEKIESVSESNDFTGKRFRIRSASQCAFYMFRYDPETFHPFTLKKYVRVMRFETTTFVFTNLAQNRQFRIHPEGYPDYQWKVSGEENAELKAIDGSSTNECTSFIITQLSNGKVMFSPTVHPTFFIKMKEADDDACLCLENNGYHSKCQWKLERVYGNYV